MINNICITCNNEINKKFTKSKECMSCIKLRTAKRGSESSAWKGGYRKDTYGYTKVHVPNHPFADSTNYVREHIYNIVKEYGEDFFVSNGGCVHHIDGNKTNNSLSNLHICTRKQNADYNSELLSMAFELVKAGYIIFENNHYRCPLLSDEKDAPVKFGEHPVKENTEPSL